MPRTGPKFIEEAEIEIDVVIAGTIERATGRFGKTTRRLDGVSEEPDFRGLVPAAQQLLPCRLRVVHDGPDKVHQLFFFRRGRHGAGGSDGVGGRTST